MKMVVVKLEVVPVVEVVQLLIVVVVAASTAPKGRKRDAATSADISAPTISGAKCILRIS